MAQQAKARSRNKKEVWTSRNLEIGIASSQSQKSIYNMNAGTLHVRQDLIVGHNGGHGELRQQGGTVAIDDTLKIESEHARVSHNGGHLIASRLENSGIFSHSSGELEIDRIVNEANGKLLFSAAQTIHPGETLNNSGELRVSDGILPTYLDLVDKYDVLGSGSYVVEGASRLSMRSDLGSSSFMVSPNGQLTLHGFMQSLDSSNLNGVAPGATFELAADALYIHDAGFDLQAAMPGVNVINNALSSTRGQTLTIPPARTIRGFGVVGENTINFGNVVHASQVSDLWFASGQGAVFINRGSVTSESPATVFFENLQNTGTVNVPKVVIASELIMNGGEIRADRLSTFGGHSPTISLNGGSVSVREGSIDGNILLGYARLEFNGGTFEVRDGGTFEVRNGAELDVVSRSTLRLSAATTGRSTFDVHPFSPASGAADNLDLVIGFEPGSSNTAKSGGVVGLPHVASLQLGEDPSQIGATDGDLQPFFEDAQGNTTAVCVHDYDPLSGKGGLSILAGMNIDALVSDIYFQAQLNGGAALTRLLAGDTNLDGYVNGQDFVDAGNFKTAFGTSWATGDFNGDRVTNGLDFVLWNGNKFQDGFVSSSLCDSTTMLRHVPEPSSLTSLLMLLMTVILSRPFCHRGNAVTK